MNRKLSWSRIILALVVTSCSTGFAATQVHQYGLTWTFDKDYEIGQFINGDWWVVGPATIVSVSPAPTVDPYRNGSMINPITGGPQGYDDRLFNFQPTSSVVYPRTLVPNESLVSTISLLEPECINSNGNEGVIDLRGVCIQGNAFLRTAAVLTCLQEPPPSGTFRPPFVGTVKPLYSGNNLRFDKLESFPPISSLPDPEYFIRGLQRPWLLHSFDFNGRAMHPYQNMLNYYREIGAFLSDASLLVHFDLEPQYKEELVLLLVQLGIDMYYTALLGHGDSSFYKWPILFSGMVLDNPSLSNLFLDGLSLTPFREDWQTYYPNQGTSPFQSDIVPTGQGWTGATVLWRQDPGTHEHEHLHPSEWDQVSDGGGIKREAYRRISTSPTWVGMALAAKIMHADHFWNHEAYFDYILRWMEEDFSEYSGVISQYYEQDNFQGGKASSAFVDEAWMVYADFFYKRVTPSPFLSSVSGLPNSIELHWEHKNREMIDYFSVYRSDQPEGPYILLASELQSTHYLDGSVQADRKYYYQVRAHGQNQESEPSISIEGQTTHLWGQEDFEDASWQASNLDQINNLEWELNLGRGGAGVTTMTGLHSDLDGRWLVVGSAQSDPTYVTTIREVGPDFTIHHDHYQKYASGDKGLVLLFRDQDNHYRVQIERYAFNVWRVLNGQAVLLGGSPALSMQHAASSAHFEISVRRENGSIVFDCTKSNWYKYDKSEFIPDPVSLKVVDQDPASINTFAKGKIGFYQLTPGTSNVPRYDNIVVTIRQTGGGTEPGPTLTPTSTTPPTPAPTVATPPTPTPIPEAGVHAPNVVFNSGAAAGIEFVLIGQDQPVAHDSAGRKDNPTGILLNAFGESFLVDTMGSDSWLTTNSESQNVILVDDAVPGPIDAWMQEGPSRATHAFPTASLFTSGVPDVSVPIQYGSMSSQLGSPNDQSFYSDRIRVDRRVFSSEGRFFVLYDEVTAVDGQQHTFSWVGHTDGSLSFPSANAVNVVKESGNRVEVRFFGPPLEFSLYDLPEDSDGDGEEEARPYFTTQKTGVGTQFLTVLFPVRSGEQSPTYASLYTPVGEAGLVRFDGADYLFFAQGGDRQEVLLDDRLFTNARFLIAKSLGQDLLEVFAIEQSGPLRWDGNLIVNESMVRSYLYQRTEAGVALTTLD